MLKSLFCKDLSATSPFPSARDPLKAASNTEMIDYSYKTHSVCPHKATVETGWSNIQAPMGGGPVSWFIEIPYKNTSICACVYLAGFYLGN